MSKLQQSKSTRDLFKQLYKQPKVFKAADYAPKHRLTAARTELAAYAYLCRQQEARDWLEVVLGEKFPENLHLESDPIFKRTYKTDLFPALRDGNSQTLSFLSFFFLLFVLFFVLSFPFSLF
jgi:uncharacterized protein (DUF736 family)